MLFEARLFFFGTVFKISSETMTLSKEQIYLNSEGRSCPPKPDGFLFPKSTVFQAAQHEAWCWRAEMWDRHCSCLA